MKLLLFLLPLAFALLPNGNVFNELNKLEGNWRMQTKKGFLYESWTKTSEAKYEGSSFKINGVDTLILEQVQLVEKPEGIFYIPTVQGQNNNLPVEFKLVLGENGKFVFENKLHDFPQRIIYSFINSDSLVARIEGISNGQEASSNYYYARVK